MPPRSTSARPKTAESDVMAKVKAAAGLAEATNSQPGMVLARRAHRNPHVRPLPTSIERIGTNVTRMAVTLKIGTQAQCAGNPG
jgi:hypothetical protein